MEMPVDTASLVIFVGMILLAVCLIVWDQCGKLRHDSRLDAEQEKREREAKKYFEQGDGK